MTVYKVFLGLSRELIIVEVSQELQRGFVGACQTLHSHREKLERGGKSAAMINA
jgi:hypothetical protein